MDHAPSETYVDDWIVALAPCAISYVLSIRA
jgi:hypothetical protein